MTTDSPSFLTALRLSDSFLPVGGYTASYGLEQYLNEGVLESPGELEAVIAGYLERLVGPCELVAVSNAHAATASNDLERVLAVDERLHAVTMAREFRESSPRAGRRLVDLLLSEDEPEPHRIGRGESDVVRSYGDAVRNETTPGHYPVVLGVITQRRGMSRLEACRVHAYSFVTDLLGAAQRLGRFSHTTVQSVLEALLSVVETVCERHVDDDVATIASFGPLTEIMGMRHERARRRLFVS